MRRRRRTESRVVLTFTMHRALLGAIESGKGLVAGDNGVITALRRRGLIQETTNFITQAGRVACREGKIDEKSRPTWVGDMEWATYMSTWGK